MYGKNNTLGLRGKHISLLLLFKGEFGFNMRCAGRATRVGGELY